LRAALSEPVPVASIDVVPFECCASSVAIPFAATVPLGVVGAAPPLPARFNEELGGAAGAEAAAWADFAACAAELTATLEDAVVAVDAALEPAAKVSDFAADAVACADCAALSPLADVFFTAFAAFGTFGLSNEPLKAPWPWKAPWPDTLPRRLMPPIPDSPPPKPPPSAPPCAGAMIANAVATLIAANSFSVFIVDLLVGRSTVRGLHR
jgi:hypothetical protein